MNFDFPNQGPLRKVFPNYQAGWMILTIWVWLLKWTLDFFWLKLFPYGVQRYLIEATSRKCQSVLVFIYATGMVDELPPCFLCRKHICEYSSYIINSTKTWMICQMLELSPLCIYSVFLLVWSSYFRRDHITSEIMSLWLNSFTHWRNSYNKAFLVPIADTHFLCWAYVELGCWNLPEVLTCISVDWRNDYQDSKRCLLLRKVNSACHSKWALLRYLK